MDAITHQIYVVLFRGCKYAICVTYVIVLLFLCTDTFWFVWCWWPLSFSEPICRDCTVTFKRHLRGPTLITVRSCHTTARRSLLSCREFGYNLLNVFSLSALVSPFNLEKLTIGQSSSLFQWPSDWLMIWRRTLPAVQLLPTIPHVYLIMNESNTENRFPQRDH